MKYSELEKNIQEVRKSDIEERAFIVGEMIQEACVDDEVATKLANKVVAKDVKSMIEKIQSIFGRTDANFKELDDRTDIDILVDWLYHINED